MKSKQVLILIKYLAIAGNIIFVLWILYNGISEGFVGSALEKLSYIGLMGLLTLNTILIAVSIRTKYNSTKT
jgi:hypothetical protein